MSKLKIIAILIILTLASELGAYIVKQNIEDNKQADPKTNDTPEVKGYFSLVLISFQIPLTVTILYLLYQILVVIGLKQ